MRSQDQTFKQLQGDYLDIGAPPQRKALFPSLYHSQGSQTRVPNGDTLLPGTSPSLCPKKFTKTTTNERIFFLTLQIRRMHLWATHSVFTVSAHWRFTKKSAWLLYSLTLTPHFPEGLFPSDPPPPHYFATKSKHNYILSGTCVFTLKLSNGNFYQFAFGKQILGTDRVEQLTSSCSRWNLSFFFKASWIFNWNKK